MSSRAPYSQPLEIAVQRNGEELLVSLSGAVDIDDSEALQGRFHETFDAASRWIIVDLSRLEFLNSLGIAELIEVHRRARARSGGLCLVNPNPRIAGVLQITRVDTLIPIHPNVEKARAAFGYASN